ncbi:gamma-glutamylcyclotransferase family protein [Marinobacterium nitratireducens]|nr:gamma-glutamylcyclotransferase family protein [Marinobacterium nitratireducens]
MEKLFTYGTLMVPDVIELVLGRRAGDTARAALPDYGCYRVHERQFPAILAERGHITHGCVYLDLTPAELQRLDGYEGELYDRRRVHVQLPDGATLDVWTYVLRRQYRRLLSPEGWDFEHFVEHQLEFFLHRLRGGNR